MTISLRCALDIMAEGQGSDDELLSMLQPLTMPEGFIFESTLPQCADTSDEDDGGPIPGPAPPAPPTPRAPIAPMAPMEPNGIESLSTKHTDSLKEDDEIEYESPAKPTTRSPAKQPSVRTKPTPELENGNESGYESAAELLKSLANSSRKRPAKSNPRRKEEEADEDSTDESPVKAVRRRAQRLVGVPDEPNEELEPQLKELHFEVVISPLPPQAAQEYTPIPPGDEVYQVLEVIKTGVPGEAWLSVEFEDGHIDQVSAQNNGVKTPRKAVIFTFVREPSHGQVGRNCSLVSLISGFI